MRGRQFALPAVVCLVFAACGHDDEPRSPGAGSPGVAGFNRAAPSLEGTWALTSTPVAGACGPLNILYENRTILTVVQAGNAFDFTMTDECGRPIPGGTGTIDPTGAVLMKSETDRPLTSTCALHLTQNWTGFAPTPADVFSGSNVLDVGASDQPGFDDCDPSIPCAVTGSFNASRCPRSGCQVTCTP